VANITGLTRRRLLSLVLTAAVPLASSRSTRDVLRRSDEVTARLGIDDMVTFLPCPPESAYFYGRDRVAPPPSPRSGPQAGLLAAPADEIPAELMDADAVLVATTPGWSLWILADAARPDAHDPPRRGSPRRVVASAR